MSKLFYDAIYLLIAHANHKINRQIIKKRKLQHFSAFGRK